MLATACACNNWQTQLQKEKPGNTAYGVVASRRRSLALVRFSKDPDEPASDKSAPRFAAPVAVRLLVRCHVSKALGRLGLVRTGDASESSVRRPAAAESSSDIVVIC
jgi:hypothetical protein